MVDEKVTQKPQLTIWEGSDVFYIIDDPPGTPLSKQITGANLFGNIPVATKINVSSAAAFVIEDEGTKDDVFVVDTINGAIALNAASPLASLYIVAPNSAFGGIRIQDSETDATTKSFRLKGGHYTNSEEPLTCFIVSSESTTNQIKIGGGSAVENAATIIRFYTAANNITVSGTQVMLITSNQRVGIMSSGAPAGRFDVIQESTSGAIPVLRLEQKDISEEFLRLAGAAASGVLTQSIVAEGDVTTPTRAGWAKVYVQDDGNQITDQAYFIPLYTLA